MFLQISVFSGALPLQCMQAAPDSIDRMVGEGEDTNLVEIIPFESSESAEDIVLRELEK